MMRRAALGGEHHHAHDALAVHLEVVAHDRDLALELRRELHDLGRRAARAARSCSRSGRCVRASADHRDEERRARRARRARAASLRCGRAGATISETRRDATATTSTCRRAASRPGADDRVPSAQRHARCRPRSAASAREMLRAPPQHRIAERAPRRACPCVQPVRSPHDAQREVAGVVEHEEERDAPAPGRAPSPKREQRDERAERQPARPDEPVADAAERAAERGAKALDLRGRLAVELRARERADGDGREVRMRVEVVRLARQRRLVRLARRARPEARAAPARGRSRCRCRAASRSSTSPGWRACARRSRSPRAAAGADAGRGCIASARAAASRSRARARRRRTSGPCRAPWKSFHAALAGDARGDGRRARARIVASSRQAVRDRDGRERREQRVARAR